MNAPFGVLATAGTPNQFVRDPGSDYGALQPGGAHQPVTERRDVGRLDGGGAN